MPADDVIVVDGIALLRAVIGCAKNKLSQSYGVLRFVSKINL